MQTGSFRDDWLFPFIIITVIYLVSFGLTIYWLLPVQQMYAPEMAAFASLLFLPHGVRVLSAWLLGWKSIGFDSTRGALYALAHIWCGGLFCLRHSWRNVRPSYVLQRAFGSSRKRGSTFQISNSKPANWRDIMVAGCLASVVNTLGRGWMLGLDTTTMTGYLLGDVSGLFACMFILMLTFKALRTRYAQS